ncbi:MAG: hypothetical protein Fur005_18500 [Roseiflexaceae bacterium]
MSSFNQPTVLQIGDLLDRLAAEPRQIAERLFDVEIAQGRLVPTTEMIPWIERQFGDIDATCQQTIVRIQNRFTLESALFNPLRSRRPNGAITDSAALDQWIAEELRHDIFADPLRDTPADLFGRIVGRYCVSASNIAKYDGWHGLVIPHEAHPLHFDEAQISDYLDVALRWIRAAQEHDPLARYPLITWNCLPKSGATIVHSHWQIAIARSMAYSRVELWRRAATHYHAETGRWYFADFAQLHQALGLLLDLKGLKGLHGLIHLTPLRSRELILLADRSVDTPTLAQAIHACLRRLVDDLGTRSLNMAIALPPLGDPQWQGFPILVRIGDRGAVLTSRNDIGAMELYGTPVIAEDPFVVAQQLKA